MQKGGVWGSSREGLGLVGEADRECARRFGAGEGFTLWGKCAVTGRSGRGCGEGWLECVSQWGGTLGGKANWRGAGGPKFPEFQGLSQSEVTLDF